MLSKDVVKRKYLRKVKKSWVTITTASLLAGILAPASASAWTARTVSEISSDIGTVSTMQDLSGYQLRWGDTLWGLSEATNFSIMDLATAFNIENPNLIFAGSHLGSVTETDEGDDYGEFYTVKKGDTLSSIAQAHNTTVIRLVELNAISIPDLIFPGQVLRVSNRVVEDIDTLEEEQVTEERNEDAYSEENHDIGSFVPRAPEETSESADDDNDSDSDEEVADEDEDGGSFEPVAPEESIEDDSGEDVNSVDESEGSDGKEAPVVEDDESVENEQEFVDEDTQSDDKSDDELDTDESLGGSYVPVTPEDETDVDDHNDDNQEDEEFEEEVNDDVVDEDNTTEEPIEDEESVEDEETVDVEIRTETEELRQEYETIWENNPNLPEGETRMQQEGRDTVFEVTYSVYYEEGIEVNRTETDRVEAVNGRPTIMERGTKVVEADPYDFDLALLNTEMLALINSERADVGVGALTYDPTLAEGTAIRADDVFSEDSLTVNSIGHMRPDGTWFDTAFEYLPNNGQKLLGENLAQNWVTQADLDNIADENTTLETILAEKFFEQYSDSPGHYENMIYADYVGFAVDVRISDNGKAFNVQIFTLDRSSED